MSAPSLLRVFQEAANMAQAAFVAGHGPVRQVARLLHVTASIAANLAAIGVKDPVGAIEKVLLDDPLVQRSTRH